MKYVSMLVVLFLIGCTEQSDPYTAIATHYEQEETKWGCYSVDHRTWYKTTRGNFEFYFCGRRTEIGDSISVFYNDGFGTVNDTWLPSVPSSNH